MAKKSSESSDAGHWIKDMQFPPAHTLVKLPSQNCTQNVGKKLRNVECYAKTTDLWSSRTTEPYLSVTIHFINDDFESLPANGILSC